MYNQLKSFVVVGELGSVSQAAKRLYVTQPAVTQHIKSLETIVGKKLLVRCGNAMSLTPEGERFYSVAQGIVLQIDGLKNIFEPDKKGTEVLKFSTIDSATSSFLPSAIRRYLSKAKDVVLKPQVYASKIAYDKLTAGEIDLAICTCDKLPRDLTGEPIIAEALVFIGTKRHANMTKIPELQKEKFILFPKESMTRDMIDHSLKKLSITPDVLLENIKVATIVSFVEAGLGVSIVPYYSVVRYLKDKSVYKIPIASGVSRTIGIAYKKGRPLPNCALSFIGCLREAAERAKT